jgi:hypothetical protein
MGEQNKSDTENFDVVQVELALTSYQIASGGQSESDTENIKFV